MDENLCVCIHLYDYFEFEAMLLFSFLNCDLCAKEHMKHVKFIYY